MMKVFMFQPRFAPLVASFAKRQTIRPPRVRPPAINEMLSLRAWTGRPYHSKQRILLDPVRCTRVWPITISSFGLSMDAATLSCLSTLNQFARADGFADWQDMIAWFNSEHGLPFHGILIQW